MIEMVMVENNAKKCYYNVHVHDCMKHRAEAVIIGLHVVCL